MRHEQEAADKGHGVGPQRYELTVGGRQYALTVAEAGLRHRLTLHVDGVQAAEATTSDQRITLRAGEAGNAPQVRVRLSTWGRVRRATLQHRDLEVDLDPAPGTRAARRHEFGRRHPVLYAVRHVLEGVATVVIPLLGLAALVQWIIRPLLERLPRISLPAIPWPDLGLPSIPWPDITLPSIPWPDLPALPPWVQWLLENRNLFVPILVGIALAVVEVRRRRSQERVRRELTERADQRARQEQLATLASAMRQARQVPLTRLARTMRQVADCGLPSRGDSHGLDRDR